jgi:hypothetical protein
VLLTNNGKQPPTMAPSVAAARIVDCFRRAVAHTHAQDRWLADTALADYIKTLCAI